MTNRILRHLALPIIAAATCFGAAPAAAQGVRTVLVDSVTVRPVLRRLWDESVRTNREQLACIGGERRASVFRVTRAADLGEVLAAGHLGTSATLRFDSDSMGVSRASSEASVEACRPPLWAGTVHTHRVEGGLEHPGLSSGDRTVVSLWHQRWRSESVFCVLFSPEKPPTCEWRPGRE